MIYQGTQTRTNINWNHETPCEFPFVSIADECQIFNAPLSEVGRTPGAFLTEFACGYCTNTDPGEEQPVVTVRWRIWENAEEWEERDWSAGKYGTHQIQPWCSCCRRERTR